MIPKFVIQHFAQKMNISERESMNRHIELEIFFGEVQKNSLVIPTKLVDETWHNFILHTRLYAEYCNNTYGQFIHHNPHLINKIDGHSCNGESGGGDKCDSAFSPKMELVESCDGGSSCDSQFSPKTIILE
jgi:hypothetical protein